MAAAVQRTLKITDKDNLIVSYIAEHAPENAVVFLTGIGKCYPLLQAPEVFNKILYNMLKNEGEVPQYYVEGNHEAIISPAVFDMVQTELARRSKGSTRYSGVSIFSNKIKCADCGGWFGSKVWHSTDRYRKVIYRCNRKYNGEKCGTPHVTEDEVKAAFVSAYNQLVTEKKERSSPMRRLSAGRSALPTPCGKKGRSWRTRCWYWWR